VFDAHSRHYSSAGGVVGEWQGYIALVVARCSHRGCKRIIQLGRGCKEQTTNLEHPSLPVFTATQAVNEGTTITQEFDIIACQHACTA
jgi:hypothetical protein